MKRTAARILLAAAAALPGCGDSDTGSADRKKRTEEPSPAGQTRNLSNTASKHMKSAMAMRKVADRTVAGWKYMHAMELEKARQEFYEIAQMPNVLKPAMAATKDSIRKLDAMIELRKDPSLAEEFALKDKAILRGAKEICAARMEYHRLNHQLLVLTLQHKALLMGKTEDSVFSAGLVSPWTAAQASGYSLALGRKRTEQEEEAWLFASLQFSYLKLSADQAQAAIKQAIAGDMGGAIAAAVGGAGAMFTALKAQDAQPEDKAK